jgi:hypothetical protein
MYVTDHTEGYILRKLQHSLNSIEMWCKCWNININKDKTQAIYVSHRLRPPEVHLTLNRQNIPSVNHVKYLSVIIKKRITLGLHVKMIIAKAFRTFIRVYSLSKSDQLSAKTEPSTKH